jgi:diguanylate cyclase (GGDEF)-like protein
MKPAPPASFKPTLICLEGPQRGMRFSLQGRELVVGRGTQADVSLEDDMISRRHLRITWRNWDRPQEMPQCTCEDLGSRNGTELGGMPLLGPTPLRERDRILLGTTVLGFFLRDADELEIDRSLYELATKDTLTGLDNRHQFNALLRHHLERVRRYGQLIALLIIDADYFKDVNDRHGHDVGDLALRHLARVIQTSCRATEVCARWGGEEFAVLAPESDAQGAIVLAERIRVRVWQFPLETPGGQSIPLTVSIGGTLLRSADTPEEAFRRADSSLYTAKHLGRNRTVFDGQAVGVDQTTTFTKKPPLTHEE